MTAYREILDELVTDVYLLGTGQRSERNKRIDNFVGDRNETKNELVQWFERARSLAPFLYTTRFIDRRTGHLSNTFSNYLRISGISCKR